MAGLELSPIRKSITLGLLLHKQNIGSRATAVSLLLPLGFSRYESGHEPNWNECAWRARGKHVTCGWDCVAAGAQHNRQSSSKHTQMHSGSRPGRADFCHEQLSPSRAPFSNGLVTGQREQPYVKISKFQTLTSGLQLCTSGRSEPKRRCVLAYDGAALPASVCPTMHTILSTTSSYILARERPEMGLVLESSACLAPFHFATLSNGLLPIAGPRW